MADITQAQLADTVRKVNSLWRSSPIASWQYVDVTFTGAGTDTDIAHTLDPKAEIENVRWEVVAIDADTTIYRDPAPTRRPWQATHIWLRAGAACHARLLLFLERE